MVSKSTCLESVLYPCTIGRFVNSNLKKKLGQAQVHVFNPSTEKAEASGSLRVQDQLGLYNEF